MTVEIKAKFQTQNPNSNKKWNQKKNFGKQK